MVWRFWGFPQYFGYRCVSVDITCALFPHAEGSPRTFDTHLTPSWAPEASGTAFQPCTHEWIWLSPSRVPRGATQDSSSRVSPATSGTGSGGGRYRAQGQQLASVNYRQPRAAQCTARPRRAPGRWQRLSARHRPSAQHGRQTALGQLSLETDGRAHSDCSSLLRESPGAGTDLCSVAGDTTRGEGWGRARKRLSPRGGSGTERPPQSSAHSSKADRVPGALGDRYWAREGPLTAPGSLPRGSLCSRPHGGASPALRCSRMRLSVRASRGPGCHVTRAADAVPGERGRAAQRGPERGPALAPLPPGTAAEGREHRAGSPEPGPGCAGRARRGARWGRCPTAGAQGAADSALWPGRGSGGGAEQGPCVPAVPRPCSAAPAAPPRRCRCTGKGCERVNLRRENPLPCPSPQDFA